MKFKAGDEVKFLEYGKNTMQCGFTVGNTYMFIDDYAVVDDDGNCQTASLHKFEPLNCSIEIELPSKPKPQNMMQAIHETHTDDIAVDTFARVMKEKMAANRAKGRDGWEMCHEDYLLALLKHHIHKGDMRDVGCIAMMIHLNRERAT